ncbi:type II secretion system F family protein [Aliivibrio fischeri]|uniref:type II secretion system F family protein n=1 Tax=Aliivibrio fischeri TaxID=668 RepID=UPI00080E2FB5|nr:type II secretion system F family protein [Aliivibrio fischeri]OCH36891.1 pilus assembly protein TadB [Aliivibrio fischeri]OED56211.1 pilus assembly protein TadB [Aliivibrio fischeri]
MLSNTTLFFILLFLSVFFVSQALILPAAGQKAKHKELTKRLKATRSKLDEESRNLLNEHYLASLSPYDKALVQFDILAKTKKLIELAGLKYSLSQTLLVTLGIGTIGCLISILSNQLWFVSITVFLSVWFILYFYLHKKISNRLSAFEEQLPDALDIIRRMLQAGQPLAQAFNEVGNEMPAPIGVEFKNTFNLLTYGYDLRLAILQMAERSPTVSMLAFSSAVLLQKDTGGNLSENLEKVSNVLRARFKLSRKIKTLSAESRLSAWILVLAPFLLFAALSFIKPEYLDPIYSDPRGLTMISYGAVSLFIGSIWIKNVISFEV